MREAIYIQNENYFIHSFGPEELKNIESMALDVYSILSDAATLKFLPKKRLYSVRDAEEFLMNSILGFHAGKNYLHFITDKLSGKIIGMIDLISPRMAKEYYVFTEYPYFIEFYLSSKEAGKSIMSELLPVFIEGLKGRQIRQLGAVVHRSNVASRKVLERAGFIYKTQFDATQDFYKISLNPKFAKQL